MKQKLTLGLLVFFLGVILTACGSDKSSSPAAVPANNNNFAGFPNNGQSIPQTDCQGQPSCAVDMAGNYTITDANAYNDAFGYNDQRHASNHIPLPTINDGRMRNNGFWSGLGNCGLRLGVAYIWTELTGNDSDADCTFEENTSSFTQFANVNNTSYPASYIYHYRQGGQRVDSLQIFIDNRREANGMNGEILDCHPDSLDLYSCRHTRTGRQLGLRDRRNGRLELERNGRAFGTFRVTRRQ